MTVRRAISLRLVGLAAALAACVPVTVNINFPQEKLEGAAGRIEDMVRSPENPPPAPPSPSPAPPAAPKQPGYEGRLADRMLAWLGPREAAAQGRSVDVVPEIRVRTPELMKAIDARRQRFPAIQQWKAKGCIGENNQGLLEPRPGEGCSGEVGKLIAAENRDRQSIHQTLMAQNNIPAQDAPRVRAAFASEARERAASGEWIQLPNGEWRRK